MNFDALNIRRRCGHEADCVDTMQSRDKGGIPPQSELGLMPLIDCQCFKAWVS